MGESSKAPNGADAQPWLQHPVAVVGMSCRLPGGCTDPQKLWDFLFRGLVADITPPKSRFRMAGHYDGSGKPGTMHCPGGMFIEDMDPAAFDAPFFNIRRADATSMDPQQRILLEVIYECLENAGVPLDILEGKKVGCLVGCNSCDYEVASIRDLDDQLPNQATGFSRCILSNRVSHFLDITGPSITIDTACSSTLIAMDIACRFLGSHQANGMLVAGSTLYTDPGCIMDRGAMSGAWSSTGRCHTFDAKADGYVRAEGFNVVYLKRLEDAIRDGDPIRGVIRGTAVNSDGRTPSLTFPSSEAHARAIRDAYRNAGITSFNGTGYLECHGTGTLAGDPIEVEGIGSVFGPSRQADRPLNIGSIKANIGHSEAAAGLSGLVKTIMILEKGIIPGTPTFLKPNPRIDFDGAGVRASRTRLRWPEDTPRRASVNSFGFGGANAHAVLEGAEYFLGKKPPGFVSSYAADALSHVEEEDVERRPYILVFSGNNADAMKRNAAALSSHLIKPNVRVNLQDVAYTLSERRTRHFHSGFCITRTSDFQPELETTGKKATAIPKVAFVFTGQGAQWERMGKDLIKTFPVAAATIRSLDAALQTLASPPTWSLMDELTQKRDTADIQRPQFSQPLVTALQLAMLAVLEDWNVTPNAVVGHSSGEIAAAVAAGRLTPEQAIQIAYLRGQAVNTSPGQPLGMLAVGVSEDEIEPYLTPDVFIACHNSPRSLTLSGSKAALAAVQDSLQADDHFARALKVDVAYHCPHMAESAAVYETMLFENVQRPSKSTNKAVMFSSVTGDQVGQDTVLEHAYWRDNMANPVRFTQALTAMLSRPGSPDVLVEIGPSNALAGPIGQIIAALPQSKKQPPRYVSAAKRGPETLEALLNAAGTLWVAGIKVDLRRANGYDSPNFVVDLPNYSWDHSNRYWHECLASRDWRFRRFLQHDLVGNKMPGVPWEAPVFSRTLVLSEQPWLRDHEVNGQIIFPASCFWAMAMEGARQAVTVNVWDARPEGAPEKFLYILKDTRVVRGLILSEDAATHLRLTITPMRGSPREWYQFKIMTLDTDDTWTTHCEGLVRIDERSSLPPPPAEKFKDTDFTAKGKDAYSILGLTGYNYGPNFQRLLDHEWVWGSRRARAQISMKEAESKPDGGQKVLKQSYYPVHPVVVDSFLQFSGFPMRQIGRNIADGLVRVPGGIDGLVMSSDGNFGDVCVMSCEANFVGTGGRADYAPNNIVSGGIYDLERGSTVLQMTGLRFDVLSAVGDPTTEHVYAHMSWEVDPFLSSDATCSVFRNAGDLARRMAGEMSDDRALSLIHRHSPALKVLEVSLSATDTSCMWLKNGRGERAEYHFVSSSPRAVASLVEQHAESKTIHTQLVDFSAPEAKISAKDMDLAILRMNSDSGEAIRAAILAIRGALGENGRLLQVLDNDYRHSITSRPDQKELFFPAEPFSLRTGFNYETGGMLSWVLKPRPERTRITCLRFAPSKNTSQEMPGVIEMFEGAWTLDYKVTTTDIKPGGVVLVIDELIEDVMSTLDSYQWNMLQDLIAKECRILWVTCGGQMSVTNPDRGAAQGFFRSMRNEETHMRTMTLDVEKPWGNNTMSSISMCLSTLLEDKPDMDCEFVERNGLIHVPRLHEDPCLNEAKYDHSRGRTPYKADPRTRDATVSLVADEGGSIDSIRFQEVTSQRLPPPPAGFAEIEIHAAGLNFKDVAIAMGIVPGDKKALGGEGSGVVTRVGKGVEHVKPGQRVVFIWPGAFSNRVQVLVQSVQVIPDWMSFEDAASLSVVYLTALHGLGGLAGLRKGQSVLIHTATGGVGNAAIQYCQHIGAEIYATAGTDEKRAALHEMYLIPKDRIFSSRTDDFEREITRLTAGRGIDVILNTTSGELLEASWNLVAEGGTMIELGRKDIGMHNRLAMEPFGRGASFRAFDLSQFRNFGAHGGAELRKLYEELFVLLRTGKLNLPQPLHRFPWVNIGEAFRFMASGKHMGKIIVSHGTPEESEVKITPSPREYEYRDDVSYLIVGGIKGLCGSIAVDLAKRGVKNIAVMSRTGSDGEEKSRMVLRHIKALGSHIDIIKGDITNIEDVRRAFSETRHQVGGIIQGAMVLFDKPVSSMTIDQFHGAYKCKVQGTWNLHNVALERKLKLEFFTMMSSIANVVGGKAQANYVAANSFLDSFSLYRHGLGLAAHTINLGAVDGTGFIDEHDDIRERLASDPDLFLVNEPLLAKMVQYSILQQQEAPITPASRDRMVTGLRLPIAPSSPLVADPRMRGLIASQDAAATGASGGRQGSDEASELKVLLRSGTRDSPVVDLMISVASAWLSKSLRLHDAVEPERPLSIYGLDSLATVEFRNWVRSEFGAVLSVVDITKAISLAHLAEAIVARAGMASA